MIDVLNRTRFFAYYLKCLTPLGQNDFEKHDIFPISNSFLNITIGFYFYINFVEQPNTVILFKKKNLSKYKYRGGANR
jgi:hypothetical protein